MSGDEHSVDEEPMRDRGFSLTEIIVAIALLGLVVTAVLASLRISIAASVSDRDQAVAFAWLQAASDEIYRADRVACTADGQGRLSAISAYATAARAAAPPPVWTGDDGAPIESAAIDVIDVEYLGRTSVDDVFDWGPDFCFEGTGFEDSPLYTQRVTIEVVFPDGTSLQTLEMVKSE